MLIISVAIRKIVRTCVDACLEFANPSTGKRAFVLGAGVGIAELSQPQYTRAVVQYSESTSEGSRRPVAAAAAAIRRAAALRSELRGEQDGHGVVARPLQVLGAAGRLRGRRLGSARLAAVVAGASASGGATPA